MIVQPSRLRIATLCCLAVFMLAGAAFAKNFDLVVTDPIHDGNVVVTVISGGVTISVVVDTIVASDNAAQKAVKIANKLVAAGVNSAIVLAGVPPKVRISLLANGATVFYDDEGTGEENQSLRSTGVLSASVGFESPFDSEDIVEGGFFTDLGEIHFELTVPSPEGDDIGQAFFDLFQGEDLLSLGITNLAFVDGLLTASFDPLAGLTGAGVTFGSSTASGIVHAAITAPEPASLVLLGSGVIGLGVSRRRRRVSARQ